MIYANAGKIDKFPPLSYFTTDIRTLTLADHQLTSIPQNGIAGLFRLSDVHLNDSKIRGFPNFTHCGKLNVLHFERKQLSYIPNQIKIQIKSN